MVVLDNCNHMLECDTVSRVAEIVRLVAMHGNTNLFDVHIKHFNFRSENSSLRKTFS